MNDLKRITLAYRLANGGDGYVYFITVGSFVKIGFSRDVARRLEKLQAGCPYPMRVAATVPGSFHLERDYHLRFILHRSGDLMEWFHHRGDLADYIAHLAAGGKPMWEPGGFEWHDDPFDPPPPPELPDETVRTIRARRQSGASHVQLSREFGIGPGHAAQLCRGVVRGGYA